jgi:hypothetical protein
MRETAADSGFVLVDMNAIARVQLAFRKGMFGGLSGL